ncbi:PREDICTED: neuronal PAS domain-containing protein 3-like, partial [Thamnophis sirtalis]|uniref:Neuronal PAS domain-containing protein 3-like n=1 Tax=Thamnophis sirtalis TaxID=35019 RepID=A0A6I9Z286_9SAUR
VELTGSSIFDYVHPGDHLEVELTGSSIFDYVHPGDHLEVADQLGLKAPLGPGHPHRPKAPLLGSSASSEGPQITDYMDLSPSELVGKSCYRFIHGEDVEGIQQSHLDLLNKGQVVTRYYRWLQKNGGFVWVQSCATISVNVKNPSERNMVWVNYILSKPECKNVALDVFQVPGIPARQTEAPSAGSDFKESDRGKPPCPAAKPPGTLAQSYPRSVAEMGRHCHLVESKPSAPETKYPPEEEASEDGAGSDAETPPRKRIKLEFPPESPPSKGKEQTPLSSSEDSDSSSDSEPEMVPQQTGALARKVNGCKTGGRKTMVPARPCTSEFTSVIQTQKGASLRSNPALSIKSEQVPQAKVGLWTCPGAKGSPANKSLRLEKPLVRQASSHLYVSIPDSVLTPPEVDNGLAKGPFGASPRAAPSSSGDTLSPPLSGSPCEDRGSATPFTPLIYPTEMDVLQRFHSSNVVVPLMHQLGNPHPGSPAGSPGLYATSTIRYAPADMTLAMPSNMLPPSHHPLSLMDISSAEAKTSREIMYHHLQRLNMVAPFGNSASLAQISGGAFAAADSLFSTLPFSVASGGIHSGSALERKED